MAENKRIASEETLVRVAEALEAMANAQNVNLNPETWADVQAIVRSGLAAKVFAIGDWFTVEKAKSASATVDGTGVTSASVTMITFLDKVGVTRAGLYDFEYNGAVWVYAGEPVTLSEFGITASGTPANGDHIVVSLLTENLVFDVIGIDHDTPSDAQFTHSLTLGLHDCYANVQFDGTEALFYCETELAAGTYNFTLLAGYDTTYGGGKTYQFTLTSAVPAGGVIMFPWGWQVQASTVKVSTYESRTATTAIESVSVAEGTSGTSLESLGECNHTHRIRYGSNNYNESAIRQWMNSDGAAGTFWVSKTNYDRPPSWNASLNGFLYGMDKSFVDIVGNVKKLTALNTLTDNTDASFVETDEKFFLFSNDELYFATENGVDQGEPYAYYENYSTLAAAGSGADSNRTKYLNGTARYYWMRSPSPWNAINVRLVSPDGSLYANYAGSGGGAALACCIV